MEKTFKSNTIEDIDRKCQTIFEKVYSSPLNIQRYTVRSEKLIAEKIAEIEMKRIEGQWHSLNFLHFLMLVYSGVALPLFFGFGLGASFVTVGVEVVIVVESAVFLWKNTDFKVFCRSSRTVGWVGMIKYSYNNYFFEDLLAISPCNLISIAFYRQTNQTLAILSLLRLFSLRRIPSLIEILEFNNRHSVKPLKFFKFLLTLSFLIHTSSCLWNYISILETQTLTKDGSSLQTVSLISQYNFALYYSVNILTSTGQSNAIPSTNTERIISMLISFQGFAFVVIIFRYMASDNSENRSDLSKMMKKIKDCLEFAGQSSVSEHLKAKIKEFYTFSAHLEKRLGGIELEKLYDHLPGMPVHSIIFKCNRCLLNKLPVLAKVNKGELVEKLSLHLKPMVFLTDDFVIYKNDTGNEMFFILIGSVNILAQDNQKILKTLKKGEYFGELALVHETKRMCSVVASKPSLIYALKKEAFIGVIQDYPEILEKIRNEGDKRKTENTLIKEKGNFYKNLKNRMLSKISKSYFARKHFSKIEQILCGITTFTPSVVSNCLDSETKSKIHTRRSHLRSTIQRRMSQEHLTSDLESF